MARPLRIQYQDAWYHVMNRGRRKETVFPDDASHFDFINLLKEATGMWRLRVSAYCLMKNHYHLLVQTPDANLDRCMRHIDGVFTQRLNRRFGWDGSLFRGRYKAILIEKDSYLLEVLRYIHCNPVHTGLVKKLGEFRWSSHHGYLSKAKQWNWLSKGTVLGMLSRNRSKQRDAYREFISDPISESVKRFYERKRPKSILGSSAFVQWVKDIYSDLIHQEEVSSAATFAPSIAAIKTAVAKSLKINQKSLMSSIRGCLNEPRNLALYLSRTLTGGKLEEIAKEFFLPQPRSVSTSVGRMKKRLENEPKLRSKMESVKRALKYVVS